jgi:glycosyltransferase involved in cell wall biosynthesis
MIDVVLPVLDEFEALPWVLGRMPREYRPIVVDNGSTDGSGELARRLGAHVVQERTPGFGAACFTGLQAADADIVCFMDCDGSLDPVELPLIAGPVARAEADLMLGARNAAGGAWPLHARMANRYLGRRLGLRDLGPMRAARRRDLLELGIADRRFGWPLEMVVRARDEGWRIGEAPTTYLPRQGRSKVTGTVRGTARAIRDMRAVLAAA